MLWTLDTEDWKYRDATRVAHAVISKVKRNDVVLLHDIHPTSVAAAPPRSCAPSPPTATPSSPSATRAPHFERLGLAGPHIHVRCPFSVTRVRQRGVLEGCPPPLRPTGPARALIPLLTTHDPLDDRQDALRH
ncbi:hypothetical protein ABZ281_06555 [Streptomyces sp. NPDC006265]|uniref:hypothetical protein n=1 Tax=Streptomyces sp. NPDC006265 TaxID=3156740 RepID=UPI0033A8D9F4